MNQQITAIIKGNKIRLTKQEGRYKSNPDDLAHSANLNFLCSDDLNRRLFQYFLDGQFAEAVKWICYHADIRFPMARTRLLRFLLTNLTCLISFSFSDEEKNSNLNLFRDWISGLSLKSYTGQDIIDLISSEGYEIERQY